MIDVLRVLKIPATIVMVLLAGMVLEAAESTENSPEADLEAATAIKVATVSRYMPVEIYGVQVLIDHETGLMRTPMPEEAAALSAALKARFGSIEAQTKMQALPILHKSGIISAQLDGSHLNFSVARAQPDGKLRYECGKDHDHASDPVTTPATGPETE